MTDDTVDASARCQAEFRQLGGFAGAGFTGNNNHRMPGYGLNDFILFGGYRKLIIVAEFRQVLLTPGAFALRCFEAFFKPLESCAQLVSRQRFGLFAGQAFDFPNRRHAVGSHHFR